MTLGSHCKELDLALKCRQQSQKRSLVIVYRFHLILDRTARLILLAVQAPKEEAKALMEEVKAPVEEVKAPVEEEKAQEEEEKAPVEEEKELVEEVKALVEASTTLFLS